MMKKQLLIFFTCVLVVAGCKKDEPESKEPGGIVVYNSSSSVGNWSIIVDGREYGKARYSVVAPSCGDPNFITIELSPGVHKITFRSLDGYAGVPIKDYTVKAGECRYYDFINSYGKSK